MHAWVLLAASVAGVGCGGGGTFGCMDRGQGGAYDECVAQSSYHHRESAAAKRAREERARMAAETLAEHQRKERADYDAAVEPCKRGEPAPCFVVAQYGMVNKHDETAVRAALDVACNGKLADACFLQGKRGGGGLAAYERACALDHVQGCLAAAALDQGRARSFEVRACELRDFATCERVGLAYADTNQRGDAEKYLKMACGARLERACRRLGELAVGR